ncbi:uncharacterized protein [Diabrotica undecimpunctata]|uniref:uncharacterized protein n=1 Tax=Diabrotica undecimpunctata TaxID=50387 RepID=UPI003B63C9A8
MMLFIVLLFVCYPLHIYSFEICNENETIQCRKLNNNLRDNCYTELSYSAENCCLPNFIRSDHVKIDFGDVFLQLEQEILHNFLSMKIYPTVAWKKALVKLSEYGNYQSCKIFNVGKDDDYMDLLKYDCYWKGIEGIGKPFLLEISSEYNSQYAHKKILFSIPDSVYFRNTVPPTKRQIFSYIDFTNANRIILKIQPLPEIYKVSHYKVEVFREKEKHSLMLDVRLLAAEQEKSIDFEYITYSEEGDYYFAISVIAKSCPEDICFKTLTPKVHIVRKGRPLVIGIVGASFLIPFVLFSLYLWNHKYRNQGELLNEPIQKVIVLFKPSFEKHNEVVQAIIDCIESFSEPETIVDRINLTKVEEKSVEKFCSDNLILSTHIVYVNPPYTDDDSSGLDYMTFNFIKEETKKNSSDRKLLVVRLPYSKKDVPSILSRAAHFDLVQDFPAFINSFSSIDVQADYSKLPTYMELSKKIEVANIEADNINVVPEIVVTEDIDEPKELDGLIQT